MNIPAARNVSQARPETAHLSPWPRCPGVSTLDLDRPESEVSGDSVHLLRCQRLRRRQCPGLWRYSAARVRSAGVVMQRPPPLLRGSSQAPAGHRPQPLSQLYLRVGGCTSPGRDAGSKPAERGLPFPARPAAGSLRRHSRSGECSGHQPGEHRSPLPPPPRTVWAGEPLNSKAGCFVRKERLLSQRPFQQLRVLSTERVLC